MAGDEDPSEIVKSKHQSESVNVSLLNINGKLYYPFQTQIEYTRHDTARLMKVITLAKPKTSDRTTAEKGMYITSPRVVFHCICLVLHVLNMHTQS